jgi:dTDP-4-dehydrorhamnose 3,5-epimerase
VLIPKGFAHGFCTLEDDTIVEYKCGGPYRPELDMGILWCDPDLAIDWPVAPDAAITSERDTRQPRLADTPPWFASAQYPESEFRDP